MKPIEYSLLGGLAPQLKKKFKRPYIIYVKVQVSHYLDEKFDHLFL